MNLISIRVNYNIETMNIFSHIMNIFSSQYNNSFFSSSKLRIEIFMISILYHQVASMTPCSMQSLIIFQLKVMDWMDLISGHSSWKQGHAGSVTWVRWNNVKSRFEEGFDYGSLLCAESRSKWAMPGSKKKELYYIWSIGSKNRFHNRSGMKGGFG